MSEKPDTANSKPPLRESADAAPMSRTGDPGGASVSPSPVGGVTETRTGTGDHAAPIVSEIREHVAELAGRELSLRQREQEIQQQYRLLRMEAQQVARRELAEAQDRLRQRSDELDAQAIEATARNARLHELEQKLALRQIEQEKNEQEVRQQIDRLRRQMEAFARERSDERETLRQRIDRVREREEELDRRIAQARDDITRERQGLAQELAARADAADNEQRDAEVEGSDAARRALADQQAQLDESWRAARAAQDQVSQQSQELEAHRRTLAEQQAAAERRRRRLADYEEQLRGRAGALEAEVRRLAELEAGLGERQRSIDDLLHQAERDRREIQRRREELLTLREQTEAREAESRQRQLALELEREDVERERATLAYGHAELAEERRRREAELDGVRSAVAEQAAEVRRAQARRLAGPRRWWLRSAAIAVLCGGAAGAAWWAWDRPWYEASAEIQLAGEVRTPEQLLWDHGQRLLTLKVVREVLADDPLSEMWKAARVELAASAGRPALRVWLDGADGEVVGNLVERVCRGYGRLAESAPPAALAVGPVGHLSADRDRLERERTKWQEERDDDASRLNGLASPSDRDLARAEVGGLRGRYGDLSRSLAEARDRLTSLMSAATPRGTVAAVDLATAVASDEMYLADAKESRASGLQYRSELSVALLLVSDPCRDLRRAVGTWADTLAEQRGLQPPATVAAALEKCAAEATGFQELLDAFLPRWQALVETVQTTMPDEAGKGLVDHQQTAAGDVHKLGEQGDAFVAGIRTQLDELSQSTDGSTRTVVITTVMRDQLTRLTGAVATVAKAAEQIDTAKNFRLDALDRQLRGLRMRMEQRHTALRQQLQLTADEQARRERNEQLLTLQGTVQDFETRREALVNELSDRLDRLRRLDEEVAQRRELEASIQHCDAELAAIVAKVAELDEQLAVAPKDDPAAAALAIGPVRVKTLAGGHRVRNAVLAGLGGVAAAFSLCLLTLVKNPLRRRPTWEAAFERAGISNPPTGAAEANRSDSLHPNPTPAADSD